MSETVQFFIKETIARQENIQHLETLDLELMACSLLDIERSKLLAFPITLNQEIKDEFRSMIRRRIDGEPLAYILGKKGFWSLDLEVNNQVLVPRPETEVLLEDILLNFNQTNLSLLDLGTGSGAIGLSLKKEKKEWDVYCSDISINALEVANKNSLKNNLEVNFVCCDWLNAFKPNSFDLLISNPPYIKSDDIRLKSDGLSHEPLEALVSGATGKEHLFVIATSSKRFLKKGGYLYLEHSPCQANELKLFLKELNFKNILEIFDLNGDKRVRDDELLRYSRQIVLPEVDIEGQRSINKTRAIIIGLGGLGTVVSNYLARMGVGNITVCDYDNIDISNLHRQVLFDSKDIGFNKAKITKEKLNQINPDLMVKAVDEKLDKNKLDSLVTKEDVVVDATDNFKIRYEINEICVNNKKPLISGSAIGWKGHVLTLDFSKKESPCYQCIYGANMEEEESCSELGILPPVTGLIGSWQALEVIKIILTRKTTPFNLIEFDALSNSIRKFNLEKDPICKVCG